MRFPSSDTVPYTQEEFHLFNQLPFELRCAIWKLCRPNRVVDIDLVPCEEDLNMTCKGVWQTSYLNDSPPVISRVCSESRAIAFGPSKKQVEVDTKTAVHDSGVHNFEFWAKEKESGFKPFADILHLWWSPGLKYNCWNFDWNPIAEFLRLSSGSQAAITADLVYPNQISIYQSYPSFQPKFDYPNYTLLEERKDYLVVWKIVNLHVSMGDALRSGLFGRLGEERVVLVDTDDKERIESFRQLCLGGPLEDKESRSCFEDLLKPVFLRRVVEKWKYELLVYWLRFKCYQAKATGLASEQVLESIWYKSGGLFVDVPQPWFEGAEVNWKGLFDENHPFVVKVLKDMPRFTPVIMFRLCEMRCYES